MLHVFETALDGGLRWFGVDVYLHRDWGRSGLIVTFFEMPAEIGTLRPCDIVFVNRWACHALDLATHSYPGNRPDTLAA